jgi:hypothetical protein
VTAAVINGLKRCGETSAVWSSSNNQQQPQQQTQKRYYQCRRGCGHEIYFDANNKTQSGKFIPLDKDTGLPHQCPQ